MKQITIAFNAPNDLTLAHSPACLGGISPGHLWVAAKALTAMEMQKYTKHPLPKSEQPTLIIAFEEDFPMILIWGHFSSTMLFVASEWLRALAAVWAKTELGETHGPV